MSTQSPSEWASRPSEAEIFALEVIAAFREHFEAGGAVYWTHHRGSTFCTVWEHSFSIPMVFSDKAPGGLFILTGARQGAHWLLMLDGLGHETRTRYADSLPCLGSGESLDSAFLAAYADFADEFLSSYHENLH